jgi:ribose transport system substrate-binding protein
MSTNPFGLSRRQVLTGGAGLAGAAALAPMLAACSAPAPSTAASAPAASTAAAAPADSSAAPAAGGLLQDYSALEGKTVAHFVVDASTPVSARSAARGKELADQYGFTLEMFDSAGDYNKVNSTLSTWVAKGVAGIVDTGVDPTPVKTGIQEVRNANIPIGGIYAGYSPGAGLMWDVTTNEWINFAKVLTYMLTRMGDDGGGVAFVNWPEVPVLRNRTALVDAFLAYYEIPKLADEVPVVPGQVPDVKSKTAALLAKYPAGSDLKCVIAGWDEIGIAAAQAIEEAGRDDVFVVSSDGLLEAFDMIREDKPFAATCCNDIETMTDICYGQLARSVGGGDVFATNIYVDAPLITNANCPPAGEYVKGEGLQSFS